MSIAAATMYLKKKKGIVVYTLFEEKQQVIEVKTVGVAPKYDMSKIPPMTKNFEIPEEKQKDFVSVLQSKEGHLIVNMLKNKKANDIINQFLTNIKKEFPPVSEKRKKHNMLSFIEEMMVENLVLDQNTLTKKLVGLSKEEIYTEFINKGLIK